MRPRNQAVLATLAGVVVGAGAVGGVLAVRGGDDPQASGTPSTSATNQTPSSPGPTQPPPDPGAGPLDPPAITFVSKSFGTKTARITLAVQQVRPSRRPVRPGRRPLPGHHHAGPRGLTARISNFSARYGVQQTSPVACTGGERVSCSRATP